MVTPVVREKMSFLCALLITLALSSPLSSHGQSATGAPSPTSTANATVNELIVLYKQDALVLPANADDIVSAVGAAQSDNRATSIRLRLQNPSGADFLIHPHGSDVARSRLASSAVFDQLQQYVLLRYPTHALADLAFQALSADDNVISVEWNAIVPLSASPSDPFYATAPDNFNYQWGLYTLNMAAAWDLERGHGYVGHIDHGIQVTHADLSQLTGRNLRMTHRPERRRAL